jgi:putative methylase
VADITLRLRDLERLLSRIPPHPRPRLDLEQYATPAHLAAPLLFEAASLGDISDRHVVDLGCGTGVFAIGAALVGARPVTGVDVDPASLEVARREAAALKADVDFVEADVSQWAGRADTVMMNPPFGAQVRGADRIFLDVAFRTAPTIYTLHNEGTRGFVEGCAKDAGYAATHAWRLTFPLRHQFRHQEKRVQEVPVVALRLVRS